MATIGTIVVDLQANTAQFHQEMGKAATGLNNVREHSGRSEKALVSFATRGIGLVVPEAEGAAHSLINLVEKATKASGAMAILAKTGLLAGVAVGAFLVGQRLREEIDNWLELGETSHKTLERLKTEAEEQTKFAEKRAAGVALLINLEGQLAQARAKSSEAILKTPLGEATAESEGAALEARIAAIDQAQKLEEANIRRTIALGAERTKALALNEQVSNAQRLVATQDFYNSVNKIADDSAKKERDTFTKATTLFLDGLTKRQELLKKAQENLKTQTEAGAIVDPQGNAEQVKQAAAKEAEGFGLLLAQGRPWRDLQEQIFANEKKFADLGVLGFASLIEDARTRFVQLGATTKAIDESFDFVEKRLAAIPQAIIDADPQIQALIQRFQQMKVEAFDAARAIQFLNSVITAGPPPVTAAEPAAVAP
jgi:hypothetical protein